MSVVGLVIEPAVDVVGLDDVYKGVGVYFMHVSHQKLCLLPGYHGIQQGQLLVGIAACSLKTGGAVVGQVPDAFIYFLRMLRDDKQGMLFIALVEHLHHLSGSKLKDNGIQRRVPSEQKAGGKKHQGIGAQDVIPDIPAMLFGKIDGEKVGAAAAGVAHQAQGNGGAVDQAAENTDQQRIIGDGLGRYHIGQNTGEKKPHSRS